MACINGCKTEEISVTLTAGAGVIQLNTFADEGSVVSFDEDETNVSEQIDSDGNFHLAGNGWKMRNFTITTYCTPEAIAIDLLWQAFSPVDFCGSGVIISNCCSGATVYPTLRLESVTAPSLGTDVGTYEFKFRGVLPSV